jgi:hypothetical protein
MFKNVLENNKNIQIPGCLSGAIDVFAGGVSIIGGRRLIKFFEDRFGGNTWKVR